MTDDTATFELPATMKIEDCEKLHAFLTESQAGDVKIDCQSVERLSGLAAQTLAMAAKAWRKDDRRLVFDAPSAGFTDSVANLGLTDMLLDEQVPA